MRFLPVARGSAVLATSMAALFTEAALAAEPPDAIKPVAYTTLSVRPGTTVDYDLAKLEARARIVYVSSGAIAFTVRMIDDDLRTVFHFSGADLHPTAIVELVRNEPVHHVETVFDVENNAKLDVYLLNVLPTRPGDLSGATPLACTIDQTDVARATIDFSPTSARYVAFRWTRLKSSKILFNIADISVLASMSEDQVPPIFPEAELHFSRESGPDFSNKLGTLADPPIIPAISP